MSGLRGLLRSAAYQSGALSFGRIRHALTVLMLHRVLDPADPDLAQSDPRYTLSLPLFEQLLQFVSDHYAVVSLRDVMDAADGARPLPDHAVLISFDDGWADNLRCAAPALKARAMPAALFAVPDAILSPDDVWWQEQVFVAARSGSLPEKLPALGELPRPLDVVAALVRMDAAERQRILAAVPAGPFHARMMLTPREVPRLADYGIDVGLHGYSHAPLTAVPDVEEEIREAAQAVGGMSTVAMTSTLGCPHGRYDERVIAGARAAGVKLIFTSDPILNRLEGGMLRSDTLGRINVEAARISLHPHRLDPASAARWLWARDCR